MGGGLKTPNPPLGTPLVLTVLNFHSFVLNNSSFTVQFEITRFELLAVVLLMIRVFLKVVLCHPVFHNVLKHCNAFVFGFQQSKSTHQILEDSHVRDSGLGYDMELLDKLLSLF